MGGASRYIQHQVALATKADVGGPVLRSVGFGHDGTIIEPPVEGG